MMKCAVTAALLALSSAILYAGEGGSMFQFNDQRFEPQHAYAFQMKTPDFDALSPADMQAGPEKMKWKKALTISLSEKPFDTQALAKLAPPFEALDQMVEAGALLVAVGAGKDGNVELLRISLPRSKRALQLDTSWATLTFDAPKEVRLSGRLVIKGDRKMHEFDPEHIPFVEADIRFVTAAPSP